MIQIINTILPVIIMLVVGIICRQKNVLSREGIDALKKLVVNITLPAVLVDAFITMDYSVKSVVLTLVMFGVCVVALLLGKILQLAFREKSNFLPYLSTGFEAGMLGYALFIMLYGAETVSTFASIDLGQTLFVFTLYKMLLSMDSPDKKYSAKQIATEMLQSPVIIAVIAGVVFGATGLYRALVPSGVASIINACTSFISAPTGAVILLTIGYDLVPTKIAWSSVAKMLAARIITMAVLRVVTGVVVSAIGFGDSLNPALNIMFILPPPFVLPIFATDDNERTYISSSLSVCTIATVVGFILLTVFQVH